MGEPILCEHSRHQQDKAHHGDGPATHWFQSHHACPADNHDGTMYAGCAKWHDWVTRMQDRKWRCTRCGETAIGRDMVVVVGPVSLVG